jgi:hypothetical protein
VIEGLDPEKINAAFDDMGGLNGVRYHVQFGSSSKEENQSLSPTK